MSDVEGSNNNNNKDEDEDDMVDTMARMGIDDGGTSLSTLMAISQLSGNFAKGWNTKSNLVISTCWIHWNTKAHCFCGWPRIAMAN